MKNNIIRKTVFSVKSAMLPCLTGEEAHNAIINDLTSDKPSMIARFGAIEIKALLYSILPPPLTFV